MIIETDFLEHWKTQLLINLLDDPSAPCYLLRLWSHCQQRKVCRFDAEKLNPAILKAIAHSKTDALALWNAFVEAGFLDIHEGGIVEAHGFYDANSQLFANWENGKMGGRPRKTPKAEKPNRNPTETQPEPIEERERAEEKEKVDKQDEGEREEYPSSPPGKEPFWYGRDYSNVKEQIIEDYSDIRAMNDPIEAAMVVCGDYSSGMYGFLVKGCGKCLVAGLQPDSIKESLFNEVEKMFGVIKVGERKQGKEACKTFVAIMREYFETVG